MKTILVVTRLCLAVTVCLFAFGCTSGKVFQTSGSATSVGSVSEVLVAVHPGSLDADSEGDFRSHSIAGLFRTTLLKELQRRGKTAASGATIEFSVTDFRLRSGSAVFMVGIMSGGDHLAGVVTVKSGATVLKTFQASAVGHDSMWSGVAMGRLSSDSRAEVFCRMLAKDIANQL